MAGVVVASLLTAVGFAFALFIEASPLPLLRYFGLVQVVWLAPVAMRMRPAARAGIAVVGGLVLLLWTACV